jgi:hypothetical protein
MPWFIDLRMKGKKIQDVILDTASWILDLLASEACINTNSTFNIHHSK